MRKAFCLFVMLQIFICVNAQQQRQFSFTFVMVNGTLIVFIYKFFNDLDAILNKPLV